MQKLTQIMCNILYMRMMGNCIIHARYFSLCEHSRVQDVLDVVIRGTISCRLPSYNNNNSVALVRERTILTERQPLIDEVSANFYG
jgi:hypothetical protein